MVQLERARAGVGRDDAMTDLETFTTRDAPKDCLVCLERSEQGQPFTKRTGDGWWLMACAKCHWEWRVIEESQGGSLKTGSRPASMRDVASGERGTPNPKVQVRVLASRLTHNGENS
jgi:hypothetical protein